MIVRVNGGRQVPADLRVTRGESACDESNLTGESRPVPKALGDDLLAGTLQSSRTPRRPRPAARAGERAAKGDRAHRKGANPPRPGPTLHGPVRHGLHLRHPGPVRGDVLRLAFRLRACPPSSRTPGQRSAFYRAMTLLVVASPCALVLSIPSAILSAIASGARRGVLFRGGAAVENLARIDVVALDKTGTLTAGDLQLLRVETFAGDEATLRQHGLQPGALLGPPAFPGHQAPGPGKRACPPSEPEDYRGQIPGQGLRARFGGRVYALGRRDLVETIFTFTNVEDYFAVPGRRRRGLRRRSRGWPGGWCSATSCARSRRGC